jgi:hypothetical protein
MKRGTIVIAAVVFGIAGLATDSAAQEIQTAGYATYIQTGATTTALANGGARVDAIIAGYVMTDDPSTPIHLVAQDCASTNLVDAYGNIERSAGYCASRDADGDMFWIWFWNGGDGGEWGVINGTGKFEGMTGGGTSVPQAGDPDGRFAIRWEGTFNMQ